MLRIIGVIIIIGLFSGGQDATTYYGDEDGCGGSSIVC